MAWFRKFFSVFFLFIFSSDLSAQFFENEAEAFTEAAARSRPVFLVFSGSDWCLPCMHFEKEILSDSLFKKFVDEELIVLKADFPQRKKLSAEQKMQNENLAGRYNKEGNFPQLVLLNPDKTVVGALGYTNQTAKKFIVELKEEMKGANNKRAFRAYDKLMGSAFEFTVVDIANEHGWRMIRESIEEVKRLEYIMSEWIDTTQVSRLAKLSGIEAMQVDCELYNLIKRSKEISELTQGAFDISFAGVGKLWKFDGTMKTIPDSGLIKNALQNVGYKKIQLLDSCKVFLSQAGMKIGFGAIGKGYAADKAKSALQQQGINAGVINASGDLIAWGTQPDGSPWKVGISDPIDKSKIILWLPVENAAVATSGDYEKYIEINGLRYAHIIDPRTGYPTKGIRSVTIISPSAELSDALATSVFVLGIEVGLNLIEQLPNTNCIIIDYENKIHYSKNLKMNLPQNHERN